MIKLVNKWLTKYIALWHCFVFAAGYATNYIHNHKNNNMEQITTQLAKKQINDNKLDIEIPSTNKLIHPMHTLFTRRRIAYVIILILNLEMGSVPPPVTSRTWAGIGIGLCNSRQRLCGRPPLPILTQLTRTWGCMKHIWEQIRPHYRNEQWFVTHIVASPIDPSSLTKKSWPIYCIIEFRNVVFCAFVYKTGLRAGFVSLAHPMCVCVCVLVNSENSPLVC